VLFRAPCRPVEVQVEATASIQDESVRAPLEPDAVVLEAVTQPRLGCAPAELHVS
jgi:hypothetical protein